MITVYNLIDIISRVLGKNLVLHRSFSVIPFIVEDFVKGNLNSVNSKFKIYKIFKYNLFTLDNTGKKLLLECDYSKRISDTEDINSMWEICDAEYAYELLKWFKEYKDV